MSEKCLRKERTGPESPEQRRIGAPLGQTMRGFVHELNSVTLVREHTSVEIHLSLKSRLTAS